MKQTIPFVKDIDFDDNIEEITGISLEQKLNLENNDSIVGNFVITGKYKESKLSINEKTFEKSLPIDITLDDKYDASKVKIDVDNFYYEIVEEKILRLHIDVLIDNLVILNKKVEPEIVYEDTRNDVINEVEIMKDIAVGEDKYVTYKVHIIRDNQTIDDIISTYNVTKEELEKYNDISNIVIGKKIIIPSYE